jgi:hypothetical protein
MHGLTEDKSDDEEDSFDEGPECVFDEFPNHQEI